MKDISKIYLLGDSWIEGEGVYDRIEKPQKNEYGTNTSNSLFEPNLPYVPENTPGTLGYWRQQNGWNRNIIEKYGINESQIINYGSSGASNYHSFKILNKILKNVQPTDLILFGFTSKYRDTESIVPAYSSYDLPLSDSNPLKKNDIIAYEKHFIEEGLDNVTEVYPNFLSSDGSHKEMNKDELNFTKDFIFDYLSTVFDEYTFENVAQMNYMFYQKWCKRYEVNIIFFDLFENYIDKKYTKKYYEVDTDMYINYGEDTYLEHLCDWESKNISEFDDYSIWQNGYVWPLNKDKNGWYKVTGQTVPHPNQHGYKLILDDLAKRIIDKKYRIIKN